MNSLQERFPRVHFYNPELVEVQQGVFIGKGSRVGSFSLIHSGARIEENCTIGSHCNICDCKIGKGVSIQTACHITHGTVIDDSVFIGPGVITLNDKLKGQDLIGPRICRGAKIGGGSVLLPGVVVGENSIIGAGSIVTGDVLPGKTFLGNPAREQLIKKNVNGML